MKCLIVALLSFAPFLFSNESQEYSEHIFYGQPVFIFGRDLSLLGGGLGYRFHEAKIGCDVSLNAMPVQICSSKGYWPFLKASLLFYPQTKGLYLGVGGNLGIFAGILSTIGYEIINQKALVFIQLDMTFPSIANFPIGTASLGIGF